MKTVKILAVGDIMLGDDTLHMRRGVGSMIRKRGAFFPFEGISTVLHSGDIVFGNLEAPIGVSNLSGSKRMHFIAPPEALYGLKEAGFSILSVANNHIVEHGERLFYETINTLRKEGIECVGEKGGEYSSMPVILERLGMRIGFLAYSMVSTDAAVPIYAMGELNCIVDDIGMLKKRSNVVVVSLHWGDEYTLYPSIEQKKIARAIADAGAQIIIGHHTHTLQPVEVHEHSIIAYNLGNFVFDMDWAEEIRIGGMLVVAIGSNKIMGWELIPTYLNRRYQPEPLRNNDAVSVTGRLSEKIQSGYQHMHEYEMYRLERRKWGSSMMRRKVFKCFPNVSWCSYYHIVQSKIKRRCGADG